MPELATFEQQVRQLRTQHALATGGELPFELFRRNVFADSPQGRFHGLGRFIDFTPEAPSVGALDCIDGRLLRKEREDDQFIRYSQIPESSTDKFYDIPRIRENNESKFLDVTEYITEIDKTPVDKPLTSFSLAGEEQRDAYRARMLMPFVMRTLFPETAAKMTVANAATHFAENRQGYFAMALAEAFERGIEIRPDLSVDAVNVAVVE